MVSMKRSIDARFMSGPRRLRSKTAAGKPAAALK
jgi:hypothetical protein